MKKLKLFCFTVIFLSLVKAHSQTNTDQNQNAAIITVLENYFELEREAIHLHIDKTTFINNESVWFQGYIINRRTNKPFFTSNVYVLLLDENGKQLSESLVYASNGVFSGKIDLGSKFKSGNYYIQVYTNWMNNFSEDESTVTKINVINPSEGLKNYSKINPESLEILLNPEGGSLIREIPDVVGIRVKDCQGNSPENLEAVIENSKGETLKKVKLNRFGFGKFDIVPNNEKIKVVVKYNDKTIEKDLPNSNLIGISLSVNSFSMENKTAIEIKTNAATLNALQSKKLCLVIHQDQKSIIYPLHFDPKALELALVLHNKDLQEGINTIRIIDSDLKQWGERLFYVCPSVKSNFNIVKNNKHNGKIGFVGYSEYPNAITSVSLLPEQTKSTNNNSPIIAGLKINPYLSQPLANADYYLSSQNRLKLYELDLALLNERQLKYNWEFMRINHPTSKYSFDMGIDLKGSIDKGIKDKTYHKVKMVSFANKIMITTDVSENGDYIFEHMLVEDSAYVNLSLHKLPKFELVNNLFKPQVLNRKKPFYKPFKINIPENCAIGDSFITDFDFPQLSTKIIKLKEIEIQNDVKNKLMYEGKLGNGMLRGFKIDENMTCDIYSFLQSNGFNVVRGIDKVTIYSGGTTSIRGTPTEPQIYIDDMRISYPDELNSIVMSAVDEIYLDKHAMVPGINSKQGIIKIYMKKNFYDTKKKKDPNSFYLTDGFARYARFKNIDYDNTQSEGFNNFGIIDWNPLILTDESGQFLFEATDCNKSKCKIIIEGMTSDGQLFHDEETVELK